MTPHTAQEAYIQSKPFYDAAIRINFKSRFQTLVDSYPRIDERVAKENYTIPLARKMEIVSELSSAVGIELKYHKTHGGWWALAKSYHRNDVSLRLEMRQWVEFFITIRSDEEYYGFSGTLSTAWDVLRVLSGDTDALWSGEGTTPTAWCFDEPSLYHVLREKFALIAELLQLLPAGSTEGWLKRPERLQLK